MRCLFLIVTCAAMWPPALSAAQIFHADHVDVKHSGISDSYARAIAQTVSTARAVAVEIFGSDMPETITATVERVPDQRGWLFNDGQDRIFLHLSSEKKLLRPATSGVFTIYGLCHEVGHLAQYRAIPDRDWMTSAATEGWAHYIGSRIVDEVHARAGENLWPDAYNYLADGTRRLKGQLASRNPPPNVVGSGKSSPRSSATRGWLPSSKPGVRLRLIPPIRDRRFATSS